MNNKQKPDWITDEQWKIKPNVYHWEQSRKAMEYVKRSQNQPPLTHQEMVQEQRQRLIQLGLNTEDYDNLHK